MSIEDQGKKVDEGVGSDGISHESTGKKDVCSWEIPIVCMVNPKIDDV